MDLARANLESNPGTNSLLSITVAYDLQAGTYTQAARSNPQHQNLWTSQMAETIDPFLEQGGSILEVGVGEATTHGGVIEFLGGRVGLSLGFDISWSRVQVGRTWLRDMGVDSHLFVADIAHIPLADASIDVVYSSHSLEPNRGQERALISECLRVAKQTVVLVEPIYELASNKAKERMDSHGYVQNLREHAEQLGAEVLDFRLLDYTSNPLNPSGVLVLKPNNKLDTPGSRPKPVIPWMCPETGTPMSNRGDYFHAEQAGLAYPVLREVALLARGHTIIASALD